MISSPNKVKIDLSSLRYNLNQVKKCIDPKTKIMGIVKSDAYGHGLVHVSEQLVQNGVFSLGVAFLDEAMELRKAGIGSPITILCGINYQHEMEALVENDLTPVVYDPRSFEILSQMASRKGKLLNIQLKVDTGMGRLGIPLSELGAVMEMIIRYRSLNLEGLMSHLSSADEPHQEFTNTQIRNFQSAITLGISKGFGLTLNSLANSAGLMAYRDSQFDMVRPGIMLYGGLPSPDFHNPLNLKPVMGLAGRILQIREMPDQTPISYGRTYHTDGVQKIAAISIGYGDGLPRALTNTGKVLIGGKRTDIIGTVCMNMILCNISEIENVHTGDEVVILGSQGEDTITGDDIARWARTISYEIFCSIGRNTVKEYII